MGGSLGVGGGSVIDKGLGLGVGFASRNRVWVWEQVIGVESQFGS